MKVNRVERHRITKSNSDWIILDDLCWKSKNLYNYANYIIRQEFISSTKQKEFGLVTKANYINKYDLQKICQTSESYKELGSQAAQKTLMILDQSWQSFFASIRDWTINKGKYFGRPKIPSYLDKESGRFICCIKNIQFKITNGYICFSWKPLREMNNKYKTHIGKDLKLIQCRFVPKGKDYIMEIVYEIEIPHIQNLTDRIASIDLGVDNIMTVTTNCGLEPFIVNGKPLKSINQYYNKELARIKSELKIKHGVDWSNRLQRLTTKRNNKVEDYIHKSSKLIIDYCLINNIDTLVCGYNQGWKQEPDIGKINNQKFVQIPYKSLVDKLSYKCENVGIIFKTINESYTSGTSFLDREPPVKENYNKERRKYRGLFVSNNGTEINADVNGSYQIMKKAFPKSFDNGIEGVGLHPVRLNIV